MKRPNENPPDTGSQSHPTEEIPQQSPQRAPAGWERTQTDLAVAAGISMLLVEGYQQPALAISNNNSICAALQSSPEHVALCDPYCGAAHERATAAQSITHYRCHAGLQCFAMPVELDSTRELVVIGGRGFVHGNDYRAFVERVRSGDLQELFSPELFQNVVFADHGDLDQAALRLTQATSEFLSRAEPEPPSETAVTEVEALPSVPEEAE